MRRTLDMVALLSKEWPDTDHAPRAPYAHRTVETTWT